MIYLNLASGTDLRPPPFVNLDIVPRWPLASRGCDVIWDARKDPLPYRYGEVSHVYAGYLFLHLAPHHHARVLADIRRVLKLGGSLIVSEVDMRLVMLRWLEDPTNTRLCELIWGEQGGGLNDEQMARLTPLERELQTHLADFDKHCQGFTEGSLRAFLASGGFPEAKRIRVHHTDVWYELSMEAY